MSLWADLIVFGLHINLKIILFIFVGVGALTFVIYLLNLLFRSTKKLPKENMDEWLQKRDFEKAQTNLDNEILSILKNRKEEVERRRD